MGLLIEQNDLVTIYLAQIEKMKPQLVNLGDGSFGKIMTDIAGNGGQGSLNLIWDKIIFKAAYLHWYQFKIQSESIQM